MIGLEECVSAGAKARYPIEQPRTFLSVGGEFEHPQLAASAAPRTWSC